MNVKLGIALVFYDWRGSLGKSGNDADFHRLSTGSLHSGTTFQAEITLDEDIADELREALDAGYQPVFWMGKRTVKE